MTLSPDCIRAVLLTVEKTPFDNVLNLDRLAQQIPDFTKEDIWYTCLKLEEGGYLSLITTSIPRSLRPGIVNIVDLTYQGHEFLNRIRDEKQWSAVKKGLKAVRSYSLEAISSLARGMTDAAISAYITELGRTGL